MPSDMLLMPLNSGAAAAWDAQNAASVLVADVPPRQTTGRLRRTGPRPTGLQARRPEWLPAYIPELQGLRGIAVLSVVLFHGNYLLQGTWIYHALQWGWAGVSLFFSLSGFLITSILIEARGKPHSIRNFYARRALRIWPVYILLLTICYLGPVWLLGDTPDPRHWTTLAAYAFFVQNLRQTPLAIPLEPTWSLAIEEQFYLAWAPLMQVAQGRRLRWLLPPILLGMIVASPVLRQWPPAWFVTTTTLANLHGIALGSLLALGLYGLRWSRQVWQWLGFSAAALGLVFAATVAAHTAWLGVAISLCFTGIVLAAVSSSGARNPVALLLRRGPLAYCGKISYGLYLMHTLVYLCVGRFDWKLVPRGVAGNAALEALRLAASIAAASLLWYGFESRILKLKRFFKSA